MMNDDIFEDSSISYASPVIEGEELHRRNAGDAEAEQDD